MLTGVNIKSGISGYTPTNTSTINPPFSQAQQNVGTGIFPRTENVQFRNVNVGMFSGPKPSYQRYSVGANSTDSLERNGLSEQPNR